MNAPLEFLHIRPARHDDVTTLNVLIVDSARVQSRGFYTSEQIEAAVQHVFGVDTTLIADGTYFVAEVGMETVGCGGWSRRRTLYGGDQRRIGAAERLDPAADAARIRAFFVAPAWARRGVGRRLLETCARAATKEGFRALELMATLPGVPFYSAFGFLEVERVNDRLPNGVAVPFVRMRRELGAPLRGSDRASHAQS